MLQNENFKRTPKCNYYDNLLRSKIFPSFPIKRISIKSSGGKIENFNCFSYHYPTIVVDDFKSIGMKLPDRSISLKNVAEVIGHRHPVKLIEVGDQNEITDWTVADYADYLQNYTNDHKLLNMITLELSRTGYNTRIQSPKFVRKIDWIDCVWPLPRRQSGDFPCVQKYCLTGMAKAFTDFHVDFGGTSVWYHVLWGKKRFYLIPPSTRNMKIYRDWMNSSGQSDSFLGDLVGLNQCFECQIGPGETLIIPSGWIHAVYTPEDSLVFGGNFLHSFSILRQLQVYAVEGMTRVQKSYRFPFFRQIHWYLLCQLLPSCARRYSGSTSASEGPEEEEEDTVMLRGMLLQPHVFYQLPYLLKSFEGWIDSQLDPSDQESFIQAARDLAGCEESKDVLIKWWAVVELMVDIVIGNSSPNDDVSLQSKNGLLEHIQHIKKMDVHTMDLLDDQVVGRAFHPFDLDLQELLSSAGFLYDLVTKDITKVGVTSQGPKEEERQQESSGLVLKIKPKSAEFKVEITNETNEEVPEAGDSHNDTNVVPSEKTGDLNGAVIEQQDHSEDFSPGASGNQESGLVLRIPTKTKTNQTKPSQQGEEKKKAKEVKPRVFPQKTKAPKRISLTYNTAESLPKQVPETHTIAHLNDSTTRRYGTRGLKLSKEFLQHTMDTEVQDQPQETQDPQQFVFKEEGEDAAVEYGSDSTMELGGASDEDDLETGAFDDSEGSAGEEGLSGKKRKKKGSDNELKRLKKKHSSQSKEPVKPFVVDRVSEEGWKIGPPPPSIPRTVGSTVPSRLSVGASSRSSSTTNTNKTNTLKGKKGGSVGNSRAMIMKKLGLK